MTAPDSFPRLVADIGGTNVRFGLQPAAGRPVEQIRALRTGSFAGPAEAARSYLDELGRTGAPAPVPRQAAFAVATAIDGDRVALTNNAWQFSQDQVRTELGLSRFKVVNDFEALALALPGLGAGDVAPIGPALPRPNLPMAVLGPGTGLGVACVVPCAAGWVALPGEGGHATLAPADDFESELLRAARGWYPHVSAERFLSGIGLPVLYRSVCAVRGEPAEDLTAEAITTRGLAAAGSACGVTVDAFCALLGSFAGNVALTYGSLGGVFLSGGIVPHLGPAFARSRFRARFEAKGRFADYLAGIGTALITAPYAALSGAARALAAPGETFDPWT